MKIVSQETTQRKPDSIQEMVSHLQSFIRQAAETGSAAHEVERELFKRLLQLGGLLLQQFFALLGIAVLTGPGAVSSGDQVALRMTFHPMVRTFGKTTATAFNAPAGAYLLGGYYSGRYAYRDAYLLTDPNDYLTHDEFVVDEPVWLEQDDVASGVDTVVLKALEWIANTQ